MYWKDGSFTYLVVKIHRVKRGCMMVVEGVEKMGMKRKGVMMPKGSA